MKTQLRYELDKNRLLKNKISQLKEEGRKLLCIIYRLIKNKHLLFTSVPKKCLLYYTHFKGFDGDDEDEIEGEKNASNKKVKTSTSYQGKKEEEEDHSNEAESTPPKVVKKVQVERIGPAEKISVIGRPELQTGVLNKTNNNLPPIKKRKEPENPDPETIDGPQQKVHCLTPSRSKEKILDDKFYITPHEAAYQVAIFASTAETKRVNEDCSYNWPCLTIQKWKRGSAKTYDCQIPLRYLPACQEALRKIYEINESHFN